MNSQSSPEAIPQQSRTNWLALTLIGVVFVVFLVVAWNRCSTSALTDYEGVILDRWAGYRNTEQGGQPYFQMLIERERGGQITVNVDGETYRRARVGMRVSSRKGKIELTEAQSKPDKYD